MRVIIAMVAGLAAGLAGAAGWAAVAYFTGFESAWIAWIIGGAVGIAVAIGATDEVSPLTGVIATAITLTAIVGGKYVALQMMAAHYKGIVAEGVYDENVTLLHVSRELAADREAAGETLAWPEDVIPEEAVSEEEFPPGIWQEAREIWNGWTPEEQEAYRASIVRGISTSIDHVATTDFAEAFGLFDIIFFGLAAVTAYSVGSGTARQD